VDDASDPALLRTIVEASSDSLGEAAHPETDAAADGEVGPEIGRYLVIDEIGAGGMGRVFRAYDPKLGREVALKRLRLRVSERATDGARMLREAKAMALLSHPNVVSIYDVDIDQGSLFIAMEYVRGSTLKTWIGRARHGWREVLAMFVQAGRGLAAAHAQGIVHRDFKPSNVVVGEDERPRVMDFGLARAVGSSESGAFDPIPDALAHAPELDAFDTQGASRNLGATLTALGTVVGTPPYMAPEQHLGENVDARTDQYAFCVALWEALHSKPAFAGRNLGELAAAKLAGPPKPPTGSGVPSNVQAIVARGLAIDPDQRWRDMPSLLAALERAAAPARRWRWPLLAAGVAGVVAAVWLVRATAPCGDGEGEIDDTWGAPARARVEQSLGASKASFAESTVTRVTAALDAYALAWTAMHRDACEATKLRHEQSDEALDLRMGCLRAREQELGALVELLALADADVTEHAIELATALVPIDRCADVSALRERVLPPEHADARVAVDQVRAQLEQARLRKRAGRLDQALALAEAARADAIASEYPPIVAEVEVELGTIMALLDRDAEAVPLLEHALDAALVARDHRTAAEAAVELTVTLRSRSGSAEDTRWLARTALGLAQGDGTDARLISRAMRGWGEVFVDRELERDAEPWFAGAVTEIEQSLGPEHPEMVAALTAHGELLHALDREREAEALLRRALAIAEQAFGPDHPVVAHALRQLAWLALNEGRLDEAMQGFDRAYAISLAALGPDHGATWSTLGMRATVLAELERYPEAIAALEESLVHVRASLPESHPNLPSTLHNLGQIYSRQGDHARAAETYREVVRLRRLFSHQGMLAAGLVAYGRELRMLGRYDEAERALGEAVRVESRAHADDDRYRATAEIELSEVLRLRGELPRARELLEQRREQLDPGVDPREAASLELALAKLRWEVGGDPRQTSVGLARTALARVEDHTEPATREVADELRAWLESHAL
jgi:eukaryotic-like serine/threonine-protein kinase